MKIPASVRNAFSDQKAKYERLKAQVDTTVGGFRKERWHYESRVKTLQSYALKLESGRFRDPQRLEDFFACTLVVANLAETDEAEKLIKQAFLVRERRPNAPGVTRKPPDQFPFDDVRLYVELAVDPAVPSKGIEGVRFEFQVKTFLQHAWSIATHDLVYKTDEVSWSKQRIAYQTKAMLEHAEVSILEAENLAASGALAKEDDKTMRLKRAIVLLREQWPNDQLPADVRRLAENVLVLTENLKLDLARLKEILDARRANSGSHPINLSPYCTVVQYLLSDERAAMIDYLERDSGRGKPLTAILIPAEIDVPLGIDRTKWRNAVSVS